MVKEKRVFNESSYLTSIQFVAYDPVQIGLIIDWSISHSCFYYIIRHDAENEGEKEHWHVGLRSIAGYKHRFRLASLVDYCSVPSCLLTYNLFEDMRSVDGFLIYGTHLLEDKKNYYSFNDYISNNASFVSFVADAFNQDFASEVKKKVDFLGLCCEELLKGRLLTYGDIYSWWLKNASRRPTASEFTYCGKLLGGLKMLP